MGQGGQKIKKKGGGAQAHHADRNNLLERVGGAKGLAFISGCHTCYRTWPGQQTGIRIPLLPQAANASQTHVRPHACTCIENNNNNNTQKIIIGWQNSANSGPALTAILLPLSRPLQRLTAVPTVFRPRSRSNPATMHAQTQTHTHTNTH